MATTKVAVVVSTLVFAVLVWPTPSVQAQSSGASETVECDRYIKAHTRSAARKLGRALDRGQYGFRPLNLDDTLVVAGEDIGREEPVIFEITLEKMGELAVVVDRQRKWEQTYVIADAAIGPIVVSKTWKPRKQRQPGPQCRPIRSAVERPSHPATSVDVEPFHYWGLRVGWRIPSPGMIEPSDQDLEEALKQTIIEFATDEEAG